MKIVVLDNDLDMNQPFWAYLKRNAEILTCEPINREIEQLLSSQEIDVVIGNESDLDLVKLVIANFPSINYALVSSHSPEEFHKITEGYGFFMQLPPAQARDHAETFLERLGAVTAKSAATASEGQLS